MIAEAEIELLVDFLRTQDFRRLRAEHPHLAGGHPTTIEISRTPEGQVTVALLDTSP